MTTPDDTEDGVTHDDDMLIDSEGFAESWVEIITVIKSTGGEVRAGYSPTGPNGEGRWECKITHAGEPGQDTIVHTGVGSTFTVAFGRVVEALRRG